MKVRRDKDDPRNTKSKTEIEEPSRVTPNTDNALPKRTKVRTDRLEPTWQKSSTDNAEPIRDCPKRESPLPTRA